MFCKKKRRKTIARPPGIKPGFLQVFRKPASYHTSS